MSNRNLDPFDFDTPAKSQSAFHKNPEALSEGTPFYDALGAANYIGISRQSFLRHVRHGGIKSIDRAIIATHGKGAPSQIFHQSDLDAFIKNNRRGSYFISNPRTPLPEETDSHD